MNFINSQDALDVYYRVKRGGIYAVASRLGFSRRARVEAAWNHSETAPKLWAHIEGVRRSLNKHVSGDPAVEPLRWFANTYLKPRPGMRALSLGAGAGEVEFRLNALYKFSLLEGFDLSKKLTDQANARAKREGESNLRFVRRDILKTDFQRSNYDLVFAFHSLHHFANVGQVLSRAKRALKPDGLLAFEEYVGPNRFQWRAKQLEAINYLIERIPPRLRTRYGLSIEKKSVKPPGLLRMVLADPSEAIDSESILPFVEKNFDVLEMKRMGGTITHSLFHDIAQNFSASDADAVSLVEMILEEENRMIEEGILQSDFVFVVAKNNEMDCVL